MTPLIHRLWFGHRRQPWAIDLGGNATGCSTCCRERIIRAIAREPRRVPRSGW